jgi:hypothetical protein
MKFVSVPFEEALNRLIEERRQRIHMMEIWKRELLKTWETLPKPEGIIVKKETFQILEGRRQLSVKATELLNGCSEDLFMVLSDEKLLWLYNSPFFEDLEEIEKKRNLKTFIITNNSPTSKYVLDDVNLNKGNYFYYNLDEAPFFITSRVEMLLLMNKGYDKNSKPFAMWTNYETLVNSYMLLFSLLWDIAGKKAIKNRFSSNQ